MTAFDELMHDYLMGRLTKKEFTQLCKKYKEALKIWKDVERDA